MTSQDFIVTPIILLLLYGVAFLFRGSATDSITRRYFIPALTVRFVGAIALGMVYQFYYGGGDTFNFYNGGAKWIWRAFTDSPILGLKMIFTNHANPDIDLFRYWDNIWYKRDAASYFVARIAGFFDLFTFHTYSATACCFAFFSFIGLWAMFMSFYRAFPPIHQRLAIAILFVPSVFFWGSGLLKDTLTIGALGWANYALLNIFEFRRRILFSVIILIFTSWLIISLKIYILLSLIAAVSVWLFYRYTASIDNPVIKVMAMPVLLLVALGTGYLALDQISSIDSRYALDNIAKTAQITAYDIRYGWGARLGTNSGYTLGELDGSFGSLLRVAPQAVAVSLFRPFLWEVRNPLMLISALESLIITFLTLRLLIQGRFKRLTQAPVLILCLTFAIIFAFAVGVSTYNFGTLARYKIPLLPYYFTMLAVLRR